MSDLNQAVERLERYADDGYQSFDVYDEKSDLRLVLSALSKAERERDLLAAECRAWRKNDECYRYCEHGIGPECEDEDWAAASTTLESARAATDAAGVLEGK